SWKNTNRLPLFITATCSFSRFDDVDLQSLKTIVSAGEEVLLNPNGGAIGLLTTTRLVYASDNFVLNRAFYNHVFTKDANGNFWRLGDILRLTKNDAYYTGINRLNFTLLGDPSMILAYPKLNYIRIDSLYYIDTPVRSDTIRALDQVMVAGHYADDNGNPIPYNGIQYVTVFDKADTLATLGNDPDSYPKNFTQRQNIIFRGKVEVKQGKFTFQFPVPKDIRYNMGRGKLVCYANGEYPYSYGGEYDNFVVGGVSQRMAEDLEGPRIRLFMNDTNFVDGGITDPNPRLLVKLYDASGINATGIGIGHDISAILDDVRQLYVLNDYYQSDMNDFRSGSVVFPFTNLPEGEHRIKVAAYDIYNNYAEAYLSFRVIGDHVLKIQRVYNYPNPMTDFTSFVIEHNWPNQKVTVEIDIFSLTGEKVGMLRYKGTFEGYMSPPIRWNRNSGNGINATPGFYVYRVRMKDDSGNTAENYGKLLIVR
ncbi:MAG: type IX secretion system sortase PorU, partial [Bacteroidales bacterium]